MKSNLFKLSYLAIVTSGLLVACNQENVISENEQKPSEILSISVCQTEFSSVDSESRATTDLEGNTSFESNDELGLYVISRSNGMYHYKNVKFTYTEGRGWSTDSDIYYYKNSDYIIYYPYNENMNISTSQTDIEEAIKNVFVNKSDFYNQETAEAYDNVDLMMAKVENPQNNNLQFKLSHEFSMIEISVPVRKYITETTYGDSKAFKYTAPVLLEWNNDGLQYDGENVKPYNVGKGIYRFIAQPGEGITAKIDGYVKYDDVPYNFSTSKPITIEKGKFKSYNIKPNELEISEKETERDLEVGDYYYSDGSIYPYGDQTGDNDLNNPMVEGCIGVIFEVGTTLQVDDSNTKEINSGIEGTIWNHASVLALTDAGSAKWSTAKKTIAENIYADFNGDLPFTVDGYKYTYEYQKLGLNENDALQKVTSFGGTEYMAPASSSGWYMPSVGQFVLILNNLGGGTYKDFMVEPTTGNRGNRKTLMSNVENKLKIVNASANVSGMWLFANEKDTDNSWAYESDTDGSNKEHFLGRPKSTKAFRYWAVLSF